MAKRIRLGNTIVGIKKEATPFTFDAPGAADAYSAFDITMTPGDEPFERAETREHFGELPMVPGPAFLEFGFKVSMMGSGTVDVPPHWATAMAAAGFRVVPTTSTNVVLTPSSTFDDQNNNPAEAYSMSVWQDGVRYDAKGGVANVVLTFFTGRGVELAFTYQGAYEGVSDSALITPSGESVQVPPSFMSAGFSVHDGYAAEIEQFSVDMGGAIGRIIDSNDPNGVKGFALTDRTIRGSMNPSMTLITDHDWFDKWRNADSAIGNIGAGPLGSIAGNIITIAMPKTQYMVPAPGDREGFAVNDIGFSVVSEPGDAEGAEMSITLT